MSADVRKQVDDIKKIALKLDEHVTQLLDDKANHSALRLADFVEIMKDMLQRLKDFLAQLGDITIITKEQRNGSSFLYKTTVKISGDIENQFPSVVTQIVWERHNSMVDETINGRKKALIKIIEMLGNILRSGD
jgi:hypothetical protein